MCILLTLLVEEGNSPVFHGGEEVNRNSLWPLESIDILAKLTSLSCPQAFLRYDLRPRDCSGSMNPCQKEDTASKIAEV